MPDKKLFFIHIPKTGGQTVNGFMEQALTPAQCATFIEEQSYQSKAFFNARRYFAGHIRLSRVLPFIKRKDFYVFTFVRDPVGQVFSHLAWAKSKSKKGADLSGWDDDYRRLFREIGALDIALPAALRAFTEAEHDYRMLFDNQQTRFLMEDSKPGPLTNADFKQALGNLRKLDFVGVTAQLKEGLAVIAKDNKLKAPKKLESKNKRAWRSEYGLETIGKPIKTALHEYIKWDTRLLEAAQEEFDKRTA